jgi:hypothetical protein
LLQREDTQTLRKFIETVRLSCCSFFCCCFWPYGGRWSCWRINQLWYSCGSYNSHCYKHWS